MTVLSSLRAVTLNKRLNIQRRLAWSLCKDDTHNRREAKPFFFSHDNAMEDGMYCTIILQVFCLTCPLIICLFMFTLLPMKRCTEQRSYLLCVSLMIPSRILSLGSSPRSDTLFSPQSGSTIDTRLLLNAAL